MATNLTSRWLDFAQTILEQTPNVKANPEDPEYPSMRSTVVWNTVAALRDGYLQFRKDIAPTQLGKKRKRKPPSQG